MILPLPIQNGLVAGIVASVLSDVETALPGSVHSPQLRSLAEEIAAGNLSSFDQGFPEEMLGSRQIIHAALVHGFGSVMLIGAFVFGFWLQPASSLSERAQSLARSIAELIKNSWVAALRE